MLITFCLSGSVEDTLNINIIDVNDVKPSCEKQLYSLDVAENTASGTAILTLVCNDGDDDPNGINNRIGSFMITDGNTGALNRHFLQNMKNVVKSF